MASNTMSIHEELEAFGERMPEKKRSIKGKKGKGGRDAPPVWLTTIDSEEEEEEDEHLLEDVEEAAEDESFENEVEEVEN